MRQNGTNKSISSKWKQIESIKAKLHGEKSPKRDIAHGVMAAATINDRGSKRGAGSLSPCEGLWMQNKPPIALTM